MGSKHNFKISDKVELSGEIGRVNDASDGYIEVSWDNGGCAVFSISDILFKHIKKLEPKEPTIFERFPLGTKVRLEATVVQHDKEDELCPIAIESKSGREFWLSREDLENVKVIKD